MTNHRYNEIISLEWDSKFFGYNIAKVIFNSIGLERLEEILKELKTKKIRLTYLMIPPANKKLNANILKNGGILVDRKVIYAKDTQPHTEIKTRILEYKDITPNNKVLDLALQAGLYSRFKIDKNFKNNEFERLYTQWITKSVSKEIAFKTIVAMSENELVGLTTIGKRDNYADIGLVAVDKNFSGKGIGSDLINFADNVAFEMKYHQIKVVTQLDNTRACKLYEKSNFKIEDVTHVYHYWQ